MLSLLSIKAVLYYALSLEYCHFSFNSSCYCSNCTTFSLDWYKKRILKWFKSDCFWSNICSTNIAEGCNYSFMMWWICWHLRLLVQFKICHCHFKLNTGNVIGSIPEVNQHLRDQHNYIKHRLNRLFLNTDWTNQIFGFSKGLWWETLSTEWKGDHGWWYFPRTSIILLGPANSL